jgi:Tfp pilus assembly protein PilV
MSSGKKRLSSNFGGNTIIIVLVAVIIVGVALLYLTKRKVQLNYPNQTPSYQVTNQTSLDQDLNAVDASINESNNGVTGVNQGLNDTPIAIPQ